MTPRWPSSCDDCTLVHQDDFYDWSWCKHRKNLVRRNSAHFMGDDVSGVLCAEQSGAIRALREGVILGIIGKDEADIYLYGTGEP